MKVLIKYIHMESPTTLDEYALGIVLDGGSLTRISPRTTDFRALPLHERQQCEMTVERRYARMGGVPMGRGPMGMATCYRRLHPCYIAGESSVQTVQLAYPVVELRGHRRLVELVPGFHRLV